MKKCFVLLILMFFVLPVFSVKTPKTIDEAIHQLEKKWKKKELETYKKLPEEDALGEMDYSTGVWIRNQWIRFSKDSTLRHTFHEMGITHADDMSDIILTCAYRKFNNMPLEIESQVKRCKDYWTPIRECEEKAGIIAQSNYDRFKIGDSISIFIYIENLVGKNGRTITCPYNDDWSFDYKKDLIVKGFVNEKYFLYGEPYFKVQINTLNLEKTRLFYNQVKQGDIVEFPLRYLLLKQPPLLKLTSSN